MARQLGPAQTPRRETIPCGGALGEGSADTPDGRRLGLALGMLVLPMYVALGAPSVALPAIGRALAVPFGARAWILAAWSLTSALAMPVAGRLMARWSPFRVLVAGVVTLAGGSALAAVGPTLPAVIVGRLIGGAGAGATVIAVFAAAAALPGRERIRALGIIAAAGALAAVGLWWRLQRRPDGFVPRRVIAARGFLAAGLVGGAVFAGYYGVLFVAPSLIEQATRGGALEAGALLVPATACSVLAGRLAGASTDRFTAWQVSAGLAALTVVGAELYVRHSLVVLDEVVHEQYEHSGRMRVEIVSCDILCAHGGERLAGDPAGVRIDTGVDAFAELPPHKAVRLAAAVTRAAEIAAA